MIITNMEAINRAVKDIHEDDLEKNDNTLEVPVKKKDDDHRRYCSFSNYGVINLLGMELGVR